MIGRFDREEEIEESKEDFRRGLRLQPNNHCYEFLGQIDNSQFGYVSHIKWFNDILVCKSFRKDCVEKKERTNGQPTKENMYREIDILNWAKNDRNANRYIIRMFGVFEDDAYFRIVMEKGDYELYKYNENNHFRLRHHLNTARDQDSRSLISDHHREVSRLYREIIDGVAYLHKNNICHCDLSLENIVVVNNSIRIIDFGLAKQYKGELPEGKGKVGKTYYTSPECFRNERWDPMANDIWSTGVILWYLLLGIQPWEMPDERDKYFRCIYAGAEEISIMLKCFANLKPDYVNRIFRLNRSQLDFLSNIFCSQDERIKMYQVKQHPFYQGHNKLESELIPKQQLTVISARKIEENPSGRGDSVWMEDKLPLGRHKVAVKLARRGLSVNQGSSNRCIDELTETSNSHSKIKIINHHYSYEKLENNNQRGISMDFSRCNPTASLSPRYNHDHRRETETSTEGMCSSGRQNSPIAKRNHNRPIPDVLDKICNRQLSCFI